MGLQVVPIDRTAGTVGSSHLTTSVAQEPDEKTWEAVLRAAVLSSVAEEWTTNH